MIVNRFCLLLIISALGLYNGWALAIPHPSEMKSKAAPCFCPEPTRPPCDNRLLSQLSLGLGFDVKSEENAIFTDARAGLSCSEGRPISTHAGVCKCNCPLTKKTVTVTKKVYVKVYLDGNNNVVSKEKVEDLCDLPVIITNN